MFMYIKLVKDRGFITLAPAIIISAILFVLTVQTNLDDLVTVYQFNTYLGKVQSNRSVDSCFANVQYKILQRTLVATSSYIDATGDYTCVGSVIAQSDYSIDLESQIFGATSTHKAIIDIHNFIKNDEKI